MTDEEAAKAKKEKEEKDPKDPKEAKEKAEAEKLKLAPEPDEEETLPKPVKFKTMGDDMVKAFLDEWNEFKLESGWLPKAKRVADTPPKDDKSSDGGKPNGDGKKNWVTEFWGNL